MVHFDAYRSVLKDINHLGKFGFCITPSELTCLLNSMNAQIFFKYGISDFGTSHNSQNTARSTVDASARTREK